MNTPVKTVTLESMYQALIKEVSMLSLNQKLYAINDFFNNNLRYADDLETWGQEDYWATPTETMRKGKADCECFASAKYFGLRDMDFPDDELRMIYCFLIGTGRPVAHMVCAWWPEGRPPSILDYPNHFVVPPAARPDLVPAFSFNTTRAWFINKDWQEISNDHLYRKFKPWQDLLKRMAA